MGFLREHDVLRISEGLEMKSKVKHILVTGGAGFIGSEVVRQLSDAGHRVTVVDNFVNGKKQNLEGFSSNRLQVVSADVRDRLAMESLLEGVNVVFHLACLGVRHSIHSPVENHEVNASATLLLLEEAKRQGVQRFVHVSTSEVYGTARMAPITEECPPFPHTVYGASKLAGECYARAYWDTYKFPTVVVRPFNSFGPRCHHEGDSGEVIPKFLLRAMAGLPLIVFGDGEQTRDFTYVEDTAKAIIIAGEVDALIGETINVGQGREVTVNQLAKEVGLALGKRDIQVEHAEARPGDVRRLIADTSKAEEFLQYAPEVSLRDGLKKLIAWYDASGLSVDELLKDECVINWTSG